MSVTATYSHAHEAFVNIGRGRDLVPFDMRLLVALWERGGSGHTGELETDLQCEGTAIRRSYPKLWDRGLVKADSGEGTFRPKRGTRTRLTLTHEGDALAVAAIRRIAVALEVPDAA